MADLIVTGTSGYATGSIDTATVLVSNVSPISARHPNGIAAGVVQIETILGSGTTLKGSTADLAARLAIALNPTGTVKLDGFTGLTTDRGLMAISGTQLQVRNHTPIGAEMMWPTATAPAEWLLEDGSAVSRSTYSKLFAVIGTTYGVGDGSTTFNVPDMRGRWPVMVDGAANRNTHANADTIGGTGGSEFITAAQIPNLDIGLDATGGIDGTANSINIDAGGGVTEGNNLDSTIQTNNTQGLAYQIPFMAKNFIIFAGV